VAPTIQHDSKGADGREHQPCIESREVTYCMLGKVVLFRGRLVECNKVYLRSLCVLCGKRNENTCKPQKRRDYTEELLIPQLV